MDRFVTRAAGVLAAVVAVCAGSPPAKAAFIVNYSPGATGASTFGSFLNLSTSQNFAERILFNSAATITAMDIYTASFQGPVGTSVTIRLWADNAGSPGTLITSFTETISVRDSDGNGGNSQIARIRATFTNALNLSANTQYWIGMSGTSTDIGLFTLTGPNAPDNARSAIFTGTTFGSTNNTGDMAFRLEGTLGGVVAAPAPAGAVLFGIGLVGLAGSRLLRRRVEVAAN